MCFISTYKHNNNYYQHNIICEKINVLKINIRAIKLSNSCRHVLGIFFKMLILAANPSSATDCVAVADHCDEVPNRDYNEKQSRGPGTPLHPVGERY